MKVFGKKMSQQMLSIRNVILLSKKRAHESLGLNSGSEQKFLFVYIKFLRGLFCHAQVFVPCIQMNAYPDDHSPKGIVVIPADFKILQVVVI